jgi:hypothetical protein
MTVPHETGDSGKRRPAIERFGQRLGFLNTVAVVLLLLAVIVAALR